MNGCSIRICLVDGDVPGLLTAEVMNWSGKMLVSSRTKLEDLAKREEITRTGVCVLTAPDPENPVDEIVYVGDRVRRKRERANRLERRKNSSDLRRMASITATRPRGRKW